MITQQCYPHGGSAVNVTNPLLPQMLNSRTFFLILCTFSTVSPTAIHNFTQNPLQQFAAVKGISYTPYIAAEQNAEIMVHKLQVLKSALNLQCPSEQLEDTKTEIHRKM